MLLKSELNKIIPIAIIINKFNLSLRKQNLLFEKDKTKENSKNKLDNTNAVGKKKTPIRKEYLPIFMEFLVAYLRKLFVNILFVQSKSFKTLRFLQDSNLRPTA
tara:strand:- start:5 stop:316 length:312 start_codon:yes stop_codon:yes gene_type:complete